MDMKDFFSDDFDFMLADWGEEILIKNLSSETIDTYTGNIIKTENEVTQNAIIERIKEKTLELYPNIYTSVDRIAYLKSESIKKGDFVTLYNDGEEKNFIVHDLENIRDVKKIFLKKIQ